MSIRGIYQREAERKSQAELKRRRYREFIEAAVKKQEMLQAANDLAVALAA